MNLIILASVGIAGMQVTAQIPDHSTLGRVLADHVVDDLVDYAALAAHGDSLTAYLEEMARPSQAQMDAAPQAVRLAFWINAYNACTLSLVIEHYPIEKRGGLASLLNAVRGFPANSIQQIPDVWSREFCRVAGRLRSLHQIRDEILRPIGEPRVHFAISCAARSCPPLAPEPYLPERIEEQLNDRVRAFTADRRYFLFVRDGRPVLRINKVLDDVVEDFGGREGLITFFRPFLSEEEIAYLDANGPARIDYLDHDWTLNDTAVSGTD